MHRLFTMYIVTSLAKRTRPVNDLVSVYIADPKSATGKPVRGVGAAAGLEGDYTHLFKETYADRF